VPKARTEFVCRECGYRNPRSLGRCPECDAWGSFDEFSQTQTQTQTQTQPASIGVAARNNGRLATASTPVRLSEIDTAQFDRLSLEMAEFARVMGGGIVNGSVTLIGGDPGVGKSTLLTQVADQVARSAGEVMYVSGEESVAQVGMRARRMGLRSDQFLFLS